MKRPSLHRLLSAFLALLVLTSSVGLTVQRHTCRQSGHTTAGLIFSTPHHGCPPPRAASHRAKAQLETAASDVVATKLLPAPLPALLPQLGGWLLPPRAVVLLAPTRWPADDASPPLRAGRRLLAFVCTLVV